MKDQRQLNLDAVKCLGAQYMRNIKIYCQNKGDKKSYFIRPTIDGKVRFISFKSAEDAQAFLGILPAASTNKNKTTFIAYFYRVVDSIETLNTKKTYHYTLKYFSDITVLPLSEITLNQLESVYAKSNKSSWNQISAILKRISMVSEDDNLNKILRILDPKNKFFYKSKKREVKNPDLFILKIMEFEANTPGLEIAKLSALILCYTGIRVGELGSLSKDDVADGTINITKTVVDGFGYNNRRATSRTTIQNHTKGKENRDIPISSQVQILFDRYFDCLIKYRKKNTNTAIHRKFFSDKMEVLSKHIGVKVTPHLCRHAFGTMFGRSCVTYDDMAKLQNLLGHASFSTTQRYITLSKPTSYDISSKLPKLSVK